MKCRPVTQPKSRSSLLHQGASRMLLSEIRDDDQIAEFKVPIRTGPGRVIGKPVQFRRCPRNGIGVENSAISHWAKSVWEGVETVRFGQLLSPETSLVQVEPD